MDPESFPKVQNKAKVGTYSALAYAGGGYVWDEVLEYRVWCCPVLGAEDIDDGSDYYFAFDNFGAALVFSEQKVGAALPIALILQREYIDEPEPGHYLHIKEERIAEWPTDLLSRPRRTKSTIPKFLSVDAPKNKLDIIRGKATYSLWDRMKYNLSTWFNGD